MKKLKKFSIMLAATLVTTQVIAAEEIFTGNINLISASSARQNSQGGLPDFWMKMSSNPSEWIYVSNHPTASALVVALKSKNIGGIWGTTKSGGFKGKLRYLVSMSMSRTGAASQSIDAIDVTQTSIASPHLGDAYTFIRRVGGGGGYTNVQDVVAVAAQSYVNNIPVSVTTECLYIWNAAAGAMEQACGMISDITLQ